MSKYFLIYLLSFLVVKSSFAQGKILSILATIDWDLKNQKGIPISSGAYIINVSVPSLGKEKNLKWFGVLRPIDLDTF
ncbi:hypothetical protein N9Y89_02140 [bacterium]|nr:hypothetical protein [bacterium]